LRDEALRLCDEVAANRVRGAVVAVAASDWLAIQLYRRETEELFGERTIREEGSVP
jgi:hypothetical protein